MAKFVAFAFEQARKFYLVPLLPGTPALPRFPEGGGHEGNGSHFCPCNELYLAGIVRQILRGKLLQGRHGQEIPVQQQEALPAEGPGSYAALEDHADGMGQGGIGVTAFPIGAFLQAVMDPQGEREAGNRTCFSNKDAYTAPHMPEDHFRLGLCLGFLCQFLHAGHMPPFFWVFHPIANEDGAILDAEKLCVAQDSGAPATEETVQIPGIGAKKLNHGIIRFWLKGTLILI